MASVKNGMLYARMAMLLLLFARLLFCASVISQILKARVPVCLLPTTRLPCAYQTVAPLLRLNIAMKMYMHGSLLL